MVMLRCKQPWSLIWFKKEVGHDIISQKPATSFNSITANSIYSLSFNLLSCCISGFSEQWYLIDLSLFHRSHHCFLDGLLNLIDRLQIVLLFHRHKGQHKRYLCSQCNYQMKCWVGTCLELELLYLGDDIVKQFALHHVNELAPTSVRAWHHQVWILIDERQIRQMNSPANIWLLVYSLWHRQKPKKREYR